MEMTNCKGEATAKSVSMYNISLYTAENDAISTPILYICYDIHVFSNRKGKLIFFYEWDIKLKWKGTLTPEDPPCGEADSDDEGDDKDTKEFSGEIEIPNLSEENDPEDIDVSVVQ